MRNGYHATVKYLLSPVLPEGYAGFIKAHLGQCGTCSKRRVMELPFGNGTRGEVHLREAKRKELGLEDERCATTRRCRSYEPGDGN
ncbi:hypothetical protein [Paraburkholderia sp. J8-2]|uniref:hypothetical protein n=1 Tax=Paraburkholderia sp. J8-2 TaxID=2805440 RepID=UPI002AB5F8D1|nr:hypothetical protein [Paraburkholderia sp. J8-2]